MEKMRKKCKPSSSGRIGGGVDNRRCRCLESNSSRKNRSIKQRKQTSIANQDFHDQDILVSDSESSTSNSNSNVSTKKIGFFSGDDLVKLEEEEDKGFKIIKKAFLSGMGSFGKHTNVVAVHKNSFSSLSGQARFQSFRVYSEATMKKCRSNGNIKFGWYGTSKDAVDSIITHGFSLCGRPQNSGMYGFGLYLSPHNSPLESAMSSIIDEDGLRHVLLCRLIMGNMEEVHPGSVQSHPSSKDFDSGVDNLLSPKKYIVWSTHMNTHILPEYVISFKAPRCLKEDPVIQEPIVRPMSPWMPFPTLISVLSRFLPPNTVSLIEKYHSEFQEKKMSRQHLIQHVRQVAGDKLLISVIKSFRIKELKTEN